MDTHVPHDLKMREFRIYQKISSRMKNKVYTVSVRSVYEDGGKCEWPKT